MWHTLIHHSYGGYRQTRAASGRQASSDNQTPAHSCRPVHTGAISKRLASVMRQGSRLEQSYRLTLGKRGRHLYAWHGVPRYLCLHNTLIYAHVSLQCVHNLMRRKHLVNACRLPPASVCNRHYPVFKIYRCCVVDIVYLQDSVILHQEVSNGLKITMVYMQVYVQKIRAVLTKLLSLQQLQKASHINNHNTLWKVRFCFPSSESRVN